MTRELMLLRHAKSDWTTDVDDLDRQITDPGKRGVQRLGVWLAQQSLQPDFVISSPAERAWITTEKTIKAMGRGIDEVIRDERVYNADLASLLSVAPTVMAWKVEKKNSRIIIKSMVYLYLKLALLNKCIRKFQAVCHIIM